MTLQKLLLRQNDQNDLHIVSVIDKNKHGAILRQQSTHNSVNIQISEGLNQVKSTK